MLTLDPAAPVLWRSPTSLQVGVAPVLAVLPQVGELEESVLAALHLGAGDAELHRLGPAHVVAAVLERLRPALTEARDDRPVPVRSTLPALVPLLVDGPPDLVRSLGGALDRLRHPTPTPGGAHVVVLAAHHVLHPHRPAPWLAGDVVHVPVVVLDQAVLVGPLVVPGATPCLRCAEEHRLDDDPAWRAIGPQLLRRRPAALADDPRVLAETAVLLSRALSRDSATGPLAGTEVRIDIRTGAVSRRATPWHERCLCRSMAPAPAGRR